MDPHRRSLQKALTSVTFHADNGRRPTGVQALTLTEALDIIFNTADHPIERTGWALQKLTQEKVPEHLQAQALAAANRASLPALAKACRAESGSARSGKLSEAAGKLHDVLKTFKKETATGTCSFDVGPCETEFDSRNGTVRLRSVSTVHKPIAQCLKMMDPRNWGRCSPHFDPEKTYEIQRDRNGRPMRDRHGNPVRGSSSPLGENWEGLLRERFDGEGISVENILDITFDVVRKNKVVTKVEMFYSLYGCEYSQLGPLSERGGLRKNSGSMIAEPSGSNGRSTRVEVTKTVRYMDFTPGHPGRFFDLGESLNVWASVMLCARADSEAVFNLCCEPQ